MGPHQGSPWGGGKGVLEQGGPPQAELRDSEMLEHQDEQAAEELEAWPAPQRH